MFDEDPLIHHDWVRFSWTNAMMKSIKLLDEELPKLSLPVLLYHGDEDVVVPLKSSEYINEAISSTDKKLKVCLGLGNDTG